MLNFSSPPTPNRGCATVLDQTHANRPQFSLITQRIDATSTLHQSKFGLNTEKRIASLALSSLIGPNSDIDASNCSSHSPHPLSWTVFWDIENVCVPSRYNGAQVCRAIVNTLMHIRDDNTPDTVRRIIVFVNTNKMQVTLRNELQSNGVLLYHVETKSRKDAADKCLITELCLTARDLQPPAGVCLLSGDQDFAYPLACIRGLGFTTAVIAPHAIASSPLLMNVPDYVRSFTKDVLNDVLPVGLYHLDTAGKKTPTKAQKRKMKQASKSLHAMKTKNAPKKKEPVQTPNDTVLKDSESASLIRESSKNNERGHVALRKRLFGALKTKKAKRAVLSIAAVSVITSSSCCVLATIIRNKTLQTCVRDVLKHVGFRVSTELLLLILVAFPLNLMALLYLHSSNSNTTKYFEDSAILPHQSNEGTGTQYKRVQPYRRKFRKNGGRATTLKNPPNL